MKFNIIQGDNRDTLKTLADNSVDAIITDPPYGIGFLGKDWDSKKATETTSKIAALHNLPSGMKHTSLADDLAFQEWLKTVWIECFRVLKPGGYILAFSAARTYHHMAMSLQLAGFEIRDQIMWIYASGFPKAQQIKGHPGWKTSLKPAHEPICMARKPFRGSTVDNVAKWGVGALNIDASRIPSESLTYPADGVRRLTFNQSEPDQWQGDTVTNEQGRFPSNVIGEIPDYQKYFYCPKVSRRERHCGFDTRDISTNPNGMWDDGVQFQNQQALSGNTEKGNNHPTVKPVALMKYLIRLVTPENSTVLDPFCGSGSTGMAAVELGHTFIGCELDPDYVKIAETRISAWNTPEPTGTNFEELFE